LSLFMLSILSCAIIFFLFKISIITIASIILIGSTYILFVSKSKKYVSAVIKGEMIIIKDVNNQNKITSVKSIKSINSRNIFGLNLTNFSYKLDGKRYYVRIFKKLHTNEIANEEILQAAINLAS
jgi:bifunctional pyridoxal-dependent enzyme with beta-cystathionase and maltose regulon repressor activities